MVMMSSLNSMLVACPVSLIGGQTFNIVTSTCAYQGINKIK